MREHIASIESHDVSVIAIVPTGSEQLEGFLKVYGPYPFKILGDPQKSAYQDLQLKKVSALKSGRILVDYLKSGRVREIFPKDRQQAKIVRKAMVSQDVYQLGGTWLIGSSGEVLWHHVDKEPADHAKVEDILLALKDLPIVKR